MLVKMLKNHSDCHGCVLQMDHYYDIQDEDLLARLFNERGPGKSFEEITEIPQNRTCELVTAPQPSESPVVNEEDSEMIEHLPSKKIEPAAAPAAPLTAPADKNPSGQTPNPAKNAPKPTDKPKDDESKADAEPAKPTGPPTPASAHNHPSPAPHPTPAKPSVTHTKPKK